MRHGFILKTVNMYSKVFNSILHIKFKTID